MAGGAYGNAAWLLFGLHAAKAVLAEPESYSSHYAWPD
jgi:hypothetical protein